MNSLVIPPRPARAAAPLAALLMLIAGCVTPHVDDLAQAECATASECGADQTCVAGACVACGDEVCDGVDNDCDGQIDETFDLQTSTEHCGACGVVCDGVCVDGECRAPCMPQDEVCNEADDDCDGQVDEDVLNACGGCGPVPEETCNEADDDCDGQVDEGLFNACGTCGPAPEEICNGEDDDCDGTTDEGVLNACGACGDVPVDVCNGEDDDCDGTADEAYPELGQPCTAGVGACQAEGRGQCAEDGLSVVCDAVPGEAIDERCDGAHAGVDDDCDGTTDEGMEVGQPCVLGEGECRNEGLTFCDPANPNGVLCDAVPGQPVDEICDSLDNNCDGVIDDGFDLTVDPQNCGGCAIVCDFANAISACVASACVLEQCQAPFEDLNGDPADGCECNRDAVDAPDPTFVDTNCDGVDGTAGLSVFVSPGAGRPDAAGTIDDPVDTLQTALTLVSAERTTVLLEEGEYLLEQPLFLSGLVRLHGGYRFDPMEADPLQRWSRRAPDDEGATIIMARAFSPAITVGEGATVRLDNLRVEVQEDEPGRASSMAINTALCAEFILSDVQVLVGDGQDGATGAEAGMAEDAAGAGAFLSGLPEGAAGGQNPACPGETDGGRGGAGAQVNQPAEAGQPGGAGAAGGTAANADAPAQPGADGAQTAGQPGRPDLPTGRIDLNAMRWITLPGRPATPGRPGGGGGGGGGGVLDPAGTAGNGGAGGGAGGCGGPAGGRGSSGTTTIGLLLSGAECRVRVVRSELRIGNGGNGGAGMPGAVGAPGAAGGLGNVVDGEFNGGAAGGHGAQGGCGGPGAAGNGGHSIGLLVVGDARAPILDEATIVAVGEPGQPGADGVHADPNCPAPLAAVGGQAIAQACCLNPADCGSLECPAAPE